jgi:hypothetical protein
MLVVFMDKSLSDEKQFECPCPPITPVISLIAIQFASPTLCPQMGQPERGNDTSSWPAGMELIVSPPHFHPTPTEIGRVRSKNWLHGLSGQ